MKKRLLAVLLCAVMLFAVLPTTVFAAPTISFTTQPVSNTSVTAGSIAGSLTAQASVSPSGTPALTWYECSRTGEIFGEPVGTGGSFTIPTDLSVTVHFYLCRATYEGAEPVNSNVAAVDVAPDAVFTAQPVASTTVTAGSITGSLSVETDVFPASMAGAAIHKWYSCSSSGSSIYGEPLGTGKSFAIPKMLMPGTYYYLCQVTIGENLTVKSSVATVTVGGATGTTATVSFTTEPEDGPTNVYEGYVSEVLTAAASVSPSGTPTLTWYACTETGLITGAPSLGTGETFNVPLNLTSEPDGDYYFLCQATYPGAAPVNSRVAHVRVSVVEESTLIFLTHPAASTTVTEGSISGNLNVYALIAPVRPANWPSLEWYECDRLGVGSGSVLGTEESFAIPTDLTPGTYYYMCQAHSDNTSPDRIQSRVAKVIVKPAEIIPRLVGDSVFRTNATTATVRFRSNVSGTCYYTVDGNPTTTLEALKSGEDAGAVTANVTKGLVIDPALLSSGAKYVHIVVVDGSDNPTDILSISMPYDIYYYDDFEAYTNNTPVADIALRITAAAPQMYIHYNGGNAANQKVITEGDTNVLQTVGTYGTGLDIRTKLSSPITSGYAVFEADIILKNVDTTFYSAGLILGMDDSDSRPISIAVRPVTREFIAQAFHGSKQNSSTVCSLDTVYHVRFDIDLTNNNYDYYIDGVKKNDAGVSFSDIDMCWFGVFNGNGTVNYDNIRFYAADSLDHAITYDANGGAGTMAGGTATAGRPFELPACAFTAPTGMHFKEWAIGSAASATRVAAGRSHTFAAATTVYAVWEANSYTVRYDGNKPSGATGEVELVPHDATYDYGTEFSLHAAPMLTGYTFYGWYKDAGCTAAGLAGDAGDSVSNLSAVNNATVILYAKWTANTDTAYKVEHYVMDTEGNWSSTATRTTNSTGTSDAVITVSALKDATLEVTNGIVYYNGMVGGMTVSETTVLPDGSRVIKLYYSREQHQLTLAKGTGISIAAGTSQYYYGTSVMINVQVSINYTWDRWTSSDTDLLAGSTAKGYSFDMPAGDVTLTASATPTRYSVSYAASQHGSITGENAYYEGAYTGTLTPDAGYALPQSITMTMGGSAYTDFTYDDTTGSISIAANKVSGNLVISGECTPNAYTVTYGTNGGTGSMTDGTATHGTPFALPACTFTAPEGKQFSEWAIGSATGTKVAAGGTYSFTADTTVYAVWESVTFVPDPVDPDPVEYEIIRGAGGEWTRGTTGGLGFTADVDYSKFTGVSVDGRAVSRDNYDSRSGSTIVTLKDSYLATLPAGTHTIRINFTNGYAEASFLLKAASANPGTGDDSMLWLCIAAVSAAGLATMPVIRRKRQNG